MRRSDILNFIAAASLGNNNTTACMSLGPLLVHNICKTVVL